MTFLHTPTYATGQQQITDDRQVKNAAGGYVFPADKWTQLDRWLITGTQGGTFYTNEVELTLQNLQVARECIAEDGVRVVRRALEISLLGLAAKQDYALYTLAMCIAARGDDTLATRKAAFFALPSMCRTGSTFFQLLSYLRGTRSSIVPNEKNKQTALFTGNGLKRAVARWFSEKPVDRLAYQMVKYRQRYGIEIRDALRLAHPNPKHGNIKNDLWNNADGSVNIDLPKADDIRNALYAWGAGKRAENGAVIGDDVLPAIVQEFEQVQHETPVEGTENAWRKVFAAKLPREALPTEWLKDPKVWEALLWGDTPDEEEDTSVSGASGMPITSLIRNLGKMSNIELITTGSDAERYVCGELRNITRLRGGRVHPITLYLAMKQYQLGHGDKGKLTWAPSRAVVEALEDAFTLAFVNVEPTGKKQLIAVDSSGSMQAAVNGYSNLTCREVALAFAFVLIRTEPDARLLAFTDGSNDTELKVAGDERLRDLIHRFEATVRGNGTDLAIPALWCGGGQAVQSRQGLRFGTPQHYGPNFPDVEAITVFTDGETWAGNTHVHQALADLRRDHGPVRFIIASTAANSTDITDPNDALSLGIAGFSAAVPTLVRGFINREF